MAKSYTYTDGATIKITNVINKNCYKACDAGTPIKKIETLYGDIADKPCAKFDYLFNGDGSFVVGTKAEDGTITKEAAGTAKSDSNDYVVLVYQKYKNTDRDVPAYRTMNNKITLKAADAPDAEGKWVGDSMEFSTERKDEIVFYEKFAEAYKGELEVEINGKIVGVDYGEADA